MTGFTWKGRNLSTIGDLIIAMEQLEDKAEAQAFKTLYIQAEQHIGTENPTELVEDNLGYMTGYLGQEDAIKLRGWLEVEHPILGNAPTTPEEAFRAGQEFAQTGVTLRDKRNLEAFERELRGDG